MRDRRREKNSSIFRLFSIATSLVVSGGLFFCVFLGLFDFSFTGPEFAIACALSAYGIGEILFRAFSDPRKKAGKGRIFLAVFFSMLLLYALAVMIMLSSGRANDNEASEEQIIPVVSPIIADSQIEQSTDELRDSSASAEPEEIPAPVVVPRPPVFAEPIAAIPEPAEEIPVSTNDIYDYKTEEAVAVSTFVSVTAELSEEAPVEVEPEESRVAPAPIFTEPITELSSDEIDQSVNMRVPAVPVLTNVDSVLSHSLAVPSVPHVIAESLITAAIPDVPAVYEPSAALVYASPIAISGTLMDEPELYQNEWIAPQSDDDFWADFYIAGEDDLILEDGTYYFDLYVNGNSAGDVEVIIENGEVSILSEDLRSYVNGYITEDAESRIFRGEEYISTSLLEERGVNVDAQIEEYRIKTVFSPDDMPIERISISGSRYSRSSKTIAGATVLDPAVFTLLTRYNLSAGFSIIPTSSFVDSLSVDLSTSNTLRLYDVNGSFMMNLRYYNKNVAFSINNIVFDYMIPEKMMRLSWGNVSPDLLYASGTSIGFRLDQSISYAPEGTKRPSHIEKMISVEKDSDVRILNEGKEIFRRTLTAGKYSLNDFVLYSGANRIKIIIAPLDGSEPEEYEIDINYSSALLAPGEVYYGAAIATGINKVANSSKKEATAFRMPWFKDSSYEWDARNAAISGYIKAGLSETVTLNSTVALSNALSDVSWFMPKIRGSFEMTHANSFGAARYNLNVGTSRNSKASFTLPSVYFRLSQQFATKWKPISGISLSGSYTLSEQAEFSDWGTAAAQLGFSGSIGIIGWNISGNANVPLKTPESFTWTASSSLNASISKNISISASGSFYSASDSKVGFTGRIAATVSFSPVKVSAAYSTSGLSASANVSDSRNSFSINMDSAKPESFDSYSFSSDYSYSGNYLGFAARASASSGFKSMRGSLSLSASSVFADGVFAFSQSIPSNFVLIRQKGILKGNEITVGAIGTSSPNKIPKSFGIGVYKGIPSGGNTSFTVFSANNSSFGSASSFDFSVPKSSRAGYVITLTAESTYSAAGYVIAGNGEVWANGSSPLYYASLASDGSVELENSDEYLFTDSDGLFIVSGIKAGLWAFDVEIDGRWYLYLFRVDDAPSYAVDIMMLGDSALSSSYTADYPTYSAVYVYSEGEYLSGDQFWDMLYSSEEGL